MAYVIFVNPIILSQAGMPQDAVFMATIISTAIAMFIMGFYTRFPLGLAPCMSMNAFFAFSVVMQMGKTWEEALAAVFASSILFLILSFSGVRQKMISAIPVSVKQAGTVGLGVFIAFVSFKNSGIIVPDAGNFIAFGGFHNPNVIIAFAGIIVMSFFLVRKNQYAVFLGMVGAAITGVLIRMGGMNGWLNFAPEVLESLPHLPTGSPISVPVEPFKMMMDTTFLASIKHLDSLLSVDSMIIWISLELQQHFLQHQHKSHISQKRNLKKIKEFMSQMLWVVLWEVFLEHQTYLLILNLYLVLSVVQEQGLWLWL